MFKLQNEKYWLGENLLGWGSGGTPPWVDAEKIDVGKREQKTTTDAAKIKALEKENETLRKRIKQLEDELKKLKK